MLLQLMSFLSMSSMALKKPGYPPGFRLFYNICLTELPRGNEEDLDHKVVRKHVHDHILYAGLATSVKRICNVRLTEVGAQWFNDGMAMKYRQLNPLKSAVYYG